MERGGRFADSGQIDHLRINPAVVQHSSHHRQPTNPLGELRVHHEVVHMLLSFGQLQLPGYHGNHQSCTAGTLGQRREAEKQSDRADEGNHWLLDVEFAQMIEQSKGG